MTVIRAKVAENGRMSLPAPVRRRLGLAKGGTVLLTLEDGEVRMTSLAEAVRQAQRLVGDKLGGGREDGLTVDGFLAERRSYWDDG